MEVTRWGKKRAEAWKKVEQKIQVADIILTHDNSSLISGSIRRITNSYWNHVALVFFVPNRDLLFNNTLVISAIDSGIEVHRIQTYSKRFDYVDIGVKRIPGLSEEVRNKIVSYMFNNVDIPYDYTRIFGYLIKYIESKIKKTDVQLKRYLINQDAFICGSFLQKAFLESVPVDTKNSVIFTPGKDVEELTPADIARSKACEWVYNPHD